GQYALPILFLMGGLGGVLRRRRQSRMLDSYAGRGGAKRRKAYFPRVDDRTDEAGRWVLSWSEFEGLVADFFRRQGYDVRESTPGPDGGVDLDLRRNGERHLVQCKNWSERPVGVKV